jgi:hypothetical protein
MTYRIYNKGNMLVLITITNEKWRTENLPRGVTWFEYDSLAAPRLYSLYYDRPERDLILEAEYTQFQKEDGTGFDDDEELTLYLRELLSLIDVAVQDQTTPLLDSYFLQSISNFTISADMTASTLTTLQYTFEATASHGLTVGDEVLLLDTAANRSFFANVLIVATNTITIDRPIDYAFPAATTLGRIVRSNMNVDGSVTPEIFTVRAGTTPFDVTRVIIQMVHSSAGDDSKFGNQPALTRGITMRFVNGTQRTVFNWKTNGEIRNFCYDMDYTDRTAQGQYGTGARITFGGQSKHGVVIRLSELDALQFIVQDDLTDLTSVKVVAEGHEVQ